MKNILIKFHTLYILATLLISFYGPRTYFHYDKIPVLIFIIFYLILVNIGFRIGVNSKIATVEVANINKNQINWMDKLLHKSLKIAVVLYIIDFIFILSNSGLNLSLETFGSNYLTYYANYYDKKEDSIFTFEFFFLVTSALPKYISLTLGVFNFQRLSKFYKRAFYLLIFLIILTQSIAIGNQKSFGDLFIFLLLGYVSKIYTQVEKRKFFIRSIFAFLSLLILFSFSQYSRVSAKDISIVEINSHLEKYSEYDLNHPVFTILGDNIGIGLSIFVTAYLSAGYYGLSLCLQLPFEWTGGVGNSIALSSIVKLLTGIDVYPSSYLGRMERIYEVPGKAQWHTIFPWLASDFSFPGALFFLFIISIIYGICWKEVREYKNPVSFCMLALLTLMFIFVPANNQIFSGYDYLLISNTIFLLWFFGRKSFNQKMILPE